MCAPCGRRPERGRSSSSSTRRTTIAVPDSPKYWSDPFGTDSQYEAFQLSDELDYSAYAEIAAPAGSSASSSSPRHSTSAAVEALESIGAPAVQDRERPTSPHGRCWRRSPQRASRCCSPRARPRSRRSDARSSGRASARTGWCCWSARSPIRLPTRTRTSRASTTFRREFAPYLIGVSDHTLGPAGAWMTAALGGVCIEKHYTIDKRLARRPRPCDERGPGRAGRDGARVRRARRCCAASGWIGVRAIRAAGARQRPPLGRARARRRRRRTSSRAEDLGFKRPGTGIPPFEVDRVIGRRARRDLVEGTVLSESDIE